MGGRSGELARLIAGPGKWGRTRAWRHPGVRQRPDKALVHAALVIVGFQLVIIHRDVLPAAVFVTLGDPVALDHLAGLGINKLLS